MCVWCEITLEKVGCSDESLFAIHLLFLHDLLHNYHLRRLHGEDGSDDGQLAVVRSRYVLAFPGERNPRGGGLHQVGEELCTVTKHGADHDLRYGYLVGAERGSGDHQIHPVHHDGVHVAEVRGVAHEGLCVRVG